MSINQWLKGRTKDKKKRKAELEEKKGRCSGMNWKRITIDQKVCGTIADNLDDRFEEKFFVLSSTKTNHFHDNETQMNWKRNCKTLMMSWNFTK